MPLHHCFLQDNDPKHFSKYLKAWFRQQRINVLEWPSHSPDSNLLENLWELLDKKIRTKPYGNKEELFNVLKEAWLNFDLTITMKMIQ